jgi:hypothetical protein
MQIQTTSPWRILPHKGQGAYRGYRNRDFPTCARQGHSGDQRPSSYEPDELPGTSLVSRAPASSCL